MNQSIRTASKREPWNKGKLVGQKAPLRLKDIWAIRVRLRLGERIRELAMFNLAVDSKLRSCDLVKLRVQDIMHGNRMAARAIIMQQKTQRPVQFEITEQTREAVASWVQHARLTADDFLFPSRVRSSPHVSTRQYPRTRHPPPKFLRAKQAVTRTAGPSGIPGSIHGVYSVSSVSRGLATREMTCASVISRLNASVVLRERSLGCPIVTLHRTRVRRRADGLGRGDPVPAWGLRGERATAAVAERRSLERPLDIAHA